ncbi:LysR substrate-binding domain-containing protein [Pseudoduganella namucuonensis]|uniref:Transcriptional regulator, LysR family n=1 Tax=Pseudoduganella namucuonensis TaxID=1035707 RepID=A0A1I7G708_9BURK|nr:LysR substrate-binding domain-containing protein [Pseudoduganella namucuonensis]SFU44198.1 transcriptional regulator, LysR family [Pseudoduganella namucuonensis]
MHFDLVDLRLLAAIADAGSLSKAAAGFPIALSAASNRLRNFEQRCGLALFTRNADGMEVTPAGRLVLDRARHVLGETERLKETLRDLAGQRRITLRLAGTTVANSTFLPAALGPFLADYPEIDLQLVEQNSSDVLLAVQAGEVDIGVLDGNLATSGVTSLPFRHDRLVLLVPSGHALAGSGAVQLKDALGFAFVCLPPERAMQRFVEEMAMQSARPLKIRVRAPSFSAIAQLVAERAGIAMLPEAVASRHVRELPVTMVGLENAWATRELRICIREWAGLSTHARQLVGYLSQGEPQRKSSG